MRSIKEEVLLRKLNLPKLRMQVVALAVVLGLLSVIGIAAPAQAADCSGWDFYDLDAGPAAANIWISNDCSDGRIHLIGTVFDESCDGRSAELYMRFYEDEDLDGGYWWYRTENVKASGCGTGKTFEFNTVSRPMYVKACVRACSGGGLNCSSKDCDEVTP
jgi:hypothetical protein